MHVGMLLRICALMHMLMVPIIMNVRMVMDYHLVDVFMFVLLAQQE